MPEVNRADRISVGDELEPMVIERVSPEPMKTVAALLQDPTPIHFDVDAVRALGLGDRPVNQGPLNMAYMLELVSRFAGGAEAIVDFRVRFLGNVFAGDSVRLSGSVAEVDSGAGTARLDLRATVAEEAVLDGAATIRLTVAE